MTPPIGMLILGACLNPMVSDPDSWASWVNPLNSGLEDLAAAQALAEAIADEQASAKARERVEAEQRKSDAEVY